MAFTQFKHSGTLNPEISVCEKKHSSFAEKAAEEGIVLLKNENILPISLSASVALLGIGADKTVKGGIGSGDVNNRQNITIYEGMEESGIRITSRDWLDDYEHRYQKARLIWKEKILEEAKHVNNPFDAYASNPFIMPEGRPVSEMDIQEAEIVVYVISRISGEGKDRRLEKGDYYLSEREEKDILFLNSRSVPIVLLINAGGPVELTDILEKAQWIKGILNISQLGQEGGRAVARILLGEAVPSGKLTTTWAKKYADVPFAENFSYLNGNLELEEYKEGIYVGYRYFDSFGVKPLFPFGFGLRPALTILRNQSEFYSSCVEITAGNLNRELVAQAITQAGVFAVNFIGLVIKDEVIVTEAGNMDRAFDIQVFKRNENCKGADA